MKRNNILYCCCCFVVFILLLLLSCVLFFSGAADSSVLTTPKAKQPRIDLTKEQKQMIKEDTLNKKAWDEIIGSAKTEGKVRGCGSLKGEGVWEFVRCGSLNI